jgi:sec-independent protein translocase protein TatC
MADETLQPVPRDEQEENRSSDHDYSIQSLGDQQDLHGALTPSHPDHSIPSEEEEEGGPVKTFLEHLEDLRWVIIKCLASLLLGMVTCLVATPQLVTILNYPLLNSGVLTRPQAITPIGPLVIAMKIALYGGITISLPFILFFVGQFIIPALKKHEKVYFLRAFIIGAGLFFLGVLLCYFWILPISFRGIVAFNEWMKMPTEFWKAEEYFSFIILFMVGMGVSFEVPVLMLTLVKVGVISHEMLVKGRMYFFVGNMVLCAFITPDAISTIFMVIPVQVLMEICILISKSWERKKRLAAAKELPVT